MGLGVSAGIRIRRFRIADSRTSARLTDSSGTLLGAGVLGEIRYQPSSPLVAIAIQVLPTAQDANQVERVVRLATSQGQTATNTATGSPALSPGNAWVAIDSATPFVKDLMGGLPVLFLRAEGANLMADTDPVKFTDVIVTEFPA